MIKKIKLYNINNTNGMIKRGGIIKEVSNIPPLDGVIFNTYFTCGIPKYLIEIEKEYGIKTTILLTENGSNGCNDRRILTYKVNLVSKIRKYFKM